MLRLIAALFALGIGVIAWVLLLPEPSKKVHVAAAPAVTPADAAPSPVEAPAEAGRDIRVVYPGPDGAQVRKLSDKVASVPVAPATPAPASAAPDPASVEAPATVASAPPVPAPTPSATTVVAAAETVAVAPPSTIGQALNINTASIDALNRIPGAGRIGRTIASHRPYRSVEDLLSKRVVRKSVYDMIKSQVAAN